MNSDPQEGHPNATLDNFLCNSHPVAYGWSWDFRSGRRVTYDVRKGFLEVYYTDKGNPMEGYPTEMDEEGLSQLLRAVYQLEGAMSKRMISEIQAIFDELDNLVQDGKLKVDNSRGKELDDDVLADVRERAKKLNEILMLMEPRLPEVLPKKKRDEIANLTVVKAAAKCASATGPETEKKPDGEKKPEVPDAGFWGQSRKFFKVKRPGS